MDKVFKIEDLRPIRDEMTISRNSRLSDKTPITYFSLGKGTSISQESYDNTTVYIGAKGCADFLIGDYAAKHTISEGDMLVVPSKTLCGVTTETGCIYTEIIIKKENNNMNKIIKSGEVMKLRDLISYEDGSITNIDVVSNDTMKFVLMAFGHRSHTASRAWKCNNFRTRGQGCNRLRGQRLHNLSRRKFPF